MQLFQKRDLNFKTASRNLLVVVLYVLLVKIGLYFALKPTTITIFWPAGGFALAVLLLGGLKYLPGIFIAGMIAGFMVMDNLWLVTALSTANMLESFSAYWLLINRFSFNSSLKTRLDFFKLVLLAGGISSAISALIGPTALLVGNIIPLSLYPTICFRWWMGDVLGIAFITPLILIWKNPPQTLTSKSNALEVLAICVSTLLVGQILFFDWLKGSDYDTQSVSWLILLIIWAGSRSGRHTTSALQLIIFIEALWSASHGVGHYANDMVKSGLFDFWLFGMMLAGGGMAMAVIADENRKIQEKLRSTEFYQRAVLDNFPFAVWLKDTESRFLSVNKGFASIFGVQNTQDLVGKNDFDIAPSDLAKSYRADDQMVLVSHQEKCVEEEILTGGLRKWFETYKAPVFDDKGVILGTVGFARDITERKQAEESLQMMRFCVDNAGDSIFWIDRKGHILYANDVACTERGYTHEEMLGMRIFDLDPDYQLGVWGPHFEDLKLRGNITLTTRHRTKDDVVYPIEVNANYVHIGGHEFNFCFLRNITARNLMEDELKTREEKFRSIIEISPVPMGLNDEQLAITYLNPAFVNTFGYSLEDIPTLAEWWLKAYPDPDYREWVKTTWQATIEQSEREHKPFPPMEINICTKAGAFKTVVISAAMIAGSKEHLVVLFDITERKKTDDYEQFRSRILEQLTTNKPLTNILETLALGVEQINSAMVCSILLLDDEGKHFVKSIAPSLPDFYNEAIDGLEIGIGVGSCGTAAFTGKSVIVEDIETHPYWTPYKELAARAGLGACWSQPILSSVNQVLGVCLTYNYLNKNDFAFNGYRIS